MLSDQAVGRLASKIMDMINSRPRSPRHEEIVAAIRTEVPKASEDGDWFIFGPADGPLKVDRSRQP